MTDKQLIRFVDKRLRQGATWREIAAEVNIPLPTLYSRIRHLGFKVAKRLAPNAPKAA